jgi:1,4-alpha-glucan branching enzyme
MLKKQHLKSRPTCKVTFTLPEEIAAESASRVGEFNSWDPGAHPLRQLRSGCWRTTVELEPGQSYRFRYLVNGSDWYNDEAADSYLVNGFDSEDSIVQT